MPDAPYHWHYDYARLAWDSGFCFNSYKTKATLNRNEIGAIDVERIIKERDISMVEKHLNTIIESKLDDEQLQILEPSFANLFRLTQLSVEYLNYCKQYLDNTVVLLKKELYGFSERNVHLKQQIVQRDADIGKLKRKKRLNKECSNVLLQNFAPKTETTLEENFRIETDKLQSEIKELKEKLNSKERFYTDGVSTITEKSTTEFSKVGDLQKQFELLKLYVDNELKHLQTQKYETDKLEEWGQLLIKKISDNTVGVKKNDSGIDMDKRNSQTQTDIEITLREKRLAKRNGQTQTDTEMSLPPQKKKQFEDCGTNPIDCLKSESSSLSVNEIKSRNNRSNNDTQALYNVAKKVREELVHRNEDTFEKLGEVLEKKVSTTIETFEDRMQMFWNKLERLEEKQSSKMNVTNKQMVKAKQRFSDSDESEDLGKVQRFPIEKRLDVATVMTKSIRKPLPPTKTNTFVDEEKDGQDDGDSSAQSTSTSTKSSESESSASDEEPLKNVNVKAQPSATTVSTLGRRSINSIHEAIRDRQLISDLKEDVIDLVNVRLKNLGVSPDWKGLPIKSYKTAHDIVTHQAKLNAKQFDSYWKVQKNILTTMNGTVSKGKRTGKENPKPKQTKSISKPPVPVPRLNLSTKQTKKELPINSNPPPSKETTTKMYASDSGESDNRFVFNKSLPNDIIEELKEKQRLNVNKGMSNDVEVHAVESEKQNDDLMTTEKPVRNNDYSSDASIEQKDLKQKSNLKNYPSYGSLIKKKVIFDMDTNDISSFDEAKPVAADGSKQKTSTTTVFKPTDNISSSSMDSTVLDGSKINVTKAQRLNETVKNDKKIVDDDNLDWDISDILC